MGFWGAFPGLPLQVDMSPVHLASVTILLVIVKEEEVAVVGVVILVIVAVIILIIVMLVLVVTGIIRAKRLPRGIAKARLVCTCVSVPMYM